MSRFATRREALQEVKQLLETLKPDHPEHEQKAARDELQELIKSEEEQNHLAKVFGDFAPELTDFISYTPEELKAPEPSVPRPEPKPSRFTKLSPEELRELKEKLRFAPDMPLQPDVARQVQQEYNPAQQEVLQRNFDNVVEAKPGPDRDAAVETFSNSAQENAANAVVFLRNKVSTMSTMQATQQNDLAAQNQAAIKDIAMNMAQNPTGITILGNTGTMIFSLRGQIGHTVGGTKLEARDMKEDQQELNTEKEEQHEMKDVTDFEADQQVVEKNEEIQDSINDAINNIDYEMKQDLGSAPEPTAE